MSVTLFIKDPAGEYPPCIPNPQSELAAVRCIRCGQSLAVGRACPASDPAERYTLRTVEVAQPARPRSRPRQFTQWLRNESGPLLLAIVLGVVFTAVAIGLTILICMAESW